MTAASIGLGKATALQFAREGAKVAICAHSNLIDKAAAEIKDQTDQEVLALLADVTQPKNTDRLINARHKKTGEMQWTRKGTHNVLQITAMITSMITSKKWERKWQQTVLSALGAVA